MGSSAGVPRCLDLVAACSSAAMAVRRSCPIIPAAIRLGFPVSIIRTARAVCATTANVLDRPRNCVLQSRLRSANKWGRMAMKKNVGSMAAAAFVTSIGCTSVDVVFEPSSGTTGGASGTGTSSVSGAGGTTGAGGDGGMASSSSSGIGGDATSSGSSGGGDVGSPCAPLGSYACDLTDPDVVLECKVHSPEQVPRLVPTLQCSAKGLKNGCYPPPASVMITKPEDLCLNACNVRGVPLMGDLCDPAGQPGLSCAVLVCDPTGTALVPDHAGCASSGTTCAKNEECATCVCMAGVCFGPKAQHCPPATLICP
jgi:hypothetical protein